MTIEGAKEKLHKIIEQADEEKVFELLSLLDAERPGGVYVYDGETLNMLRERREEYLSGNSKLYTPEESLEYIRMHVKSNGI